MTSFVEKIQSKFATSEQILKGVVDSVPDAFKEDNELLLKVTIDALTNLTNEFVAFSRCSLSLHNSIEALEGIDAPSVLVEDLLDDAINIVNDYIEWNYILGLTGATPDNAVKRRGCVLRRLDVV